MGVSDLTIDDLGPQGDGIHQGPRGRIYVDRALPGDFLRARIRRDEMGVPRGDIVELLEPSPYRREPPCPHYERCGGCTLQHLEQDTYRGWKLQLVADALERQGLQPREWREPVFIGHGNRRRATFSAVKRSGGVVLGYYRRRSQEIADVDTCLIADSRLMQLRATLKTFLAALLVEGEPADFFVQLAGDAVDLVITGPVKHEAIAALLEKSPVTRVSWRAHEKDAITPLQSKGPVSVTFGPLVVKLPPAAFLQPTVEGEEALVEAVMSALPPKGRFADLFSGCGTFSGPMLERGPVDAYEMVPSAVGALAKAAKDEPLQAFRRDLFRHPLRRDELNRYDAIVFDPPRAGCPEQATELATAKTRTIVAVSCNPSTFARDARILCDGGYWLQSIQAVDQFLWSHHVEVVGVFTKRKSGAHR